MNSPNLNNDHDNLPKLQHWQVKTPLPPRFQQNVWRRIEASEARKTDSFWQQCLHWYQALTARPAWAMTYATIFLLAGSGLGLLHGQQTAARVNHTLAARYLQSVDPYQAQH